MAVVNDVMKMRKLADGIPVPAGQTVELKPGGLHMMFMAVKEPFVEGGKVTVKLTFEKAGAIDVVLPVGPAGASKALRFSPIAIAPAHAGAVVRSSHKPQALPAAMRFASTDGRRS